MITACDPAEVAAELYREKLACGCVVTITRDYRRVTDSSQCQDKRAVTAFYALVGAAFEEGRKTVVAGNSVEAWKKGVPA